MTGSEFYSAWVGKPRVDRELAALQEAINGNHVAWPMVKVPCGPESYFFATADYFAVGDDSDFLRMPVSGPIAQHIADVLGMCLPTARMVDRIWVAAKTGGIVLAPDPIAPDGNMETLERLAAHERKIKRALERVSPAGRGCLIAGHKKDVVVSPKMLKRTGWLAFYGMHYLDGTPIQGLNLEAHFASYSDYSHGLRLIAPLMVVDGREMAVAEVLKDPRLCHLLSGEGPVAVRYELVKSPSQELHAMVIPPTIKRGSNGIVVEKWQAVIGASVDGDFGPKTEQLTKEWQARHGLTPDGVVGPKTWSAWLMVAERPTQPQLPDVIPFVKAKHFGKAINAPRLLVVHAMQWGETAKTAENCAAFFTNPQRRKKDGTLAPVTASAHYCIDCDSVVQCVPEEVEAFHTPGMLGGRYVNSISIGLEHAGFSQQTAEEWVDQYSLSMLRLSAQLAARICRKYSIPIKRLTVDELQSGEAGICGHVDCTKATGVGDHWDPGPFFPWDRYLAMIKEYMG